MMNSYSFESFEESPDSIKLNRAITKVKELREKFKDTRYRVDKYANSLDCILKTTYLTHKNNNQYR